MPLAVPTLTVAKSGANTVATLAGGDASALNTVKTLKVTGRLGTAPWVTQGTRTGDGTVTLALDDGYYFFRNDSTLAAESNVSNVVYFNVQNEDQSVYDRCHDAVVSRLLLLDLEDIHGKIYKKIFPDPVNVSMPCVFATVDGVNESFVGGVNDRDDISYPIRISIADRNDSDYVKPLGKYSVWREKIISAFVSQRLPGVVEVNNCEVTPQAVALENLPAYQFFVSSLVLNFIVRKTRGL